VKSELERTRAELQLWADEHGGRDATYGDGIRPIFDAHKVRRYDSHWNWTRQDALDLYYEYACGRREFAWNRALRDRLYHSEEPRDARGDRHGALLRRQGGRRRPPAHRVDDCAAARGAARDDQRRPGVPRGAVADWAGVRGERARRDCVPRADARRRARHGGVCARDARRRQGRQQAGRGGEPRGGGDVGGRDRGAHRARAGAHARERRAQAGARGAGADGAEQRAARLSARADRQCDRRHVADARHAVPVGARRVGPTRGARADQGLFPRARGDGGRRRRRVVCRQDGADLGLRRQLDRPRAGQVLPARRRPRVRDDVQVQLERVRAVPRRVRDARLGAVAADRAAVQRRLGGRPRGDGRVHLRERARRHRHCGAVRGDQRAEHRDQRYRRRAASWRIG
jgi:3-oxoacyl-ACP reductase-like protein